MIATQLLPFGAPAEAASFQMHARAAGKAGTWRLLYIIKGEILRLELPPPARTPCRRDRLWEHACLEAFFEIQTASNVGNPYLELNLAPSGDWNLYRFDAYRLGMRRQQDAIAPEIAVRRTESTFVLAATLQLPLNARTRVSRLGLTAVLPVHGTPQPLYFSIRHPEPKPDFHLRAGWNKLID